MARLGSFEEPMASEVWRVLCLPLHARSLRQ
jgi:hypothetical protein